MQNINYHILRFVIFAHGVFCLIASCVHGGRHGVCNYNCGNRGNTIVLSVGGVDKLSNVSTLVYQHLECPESMSGPGCEQKCDCTERETCHYIRGCHIGKLYFGTVPDSKNC